MQRSGSSIDVEAEAQVVQISLLVSTINMTGADGADATRSKSRAADFQITLGS